MNSAIDLYMVYQFIKRLTSPYTEWDAYKTGVIDADGNIIVQKSTRSTPQRKSFTKFDLMVMKLKGLLGKVPGGTSKIGSYLAALWLIREWNCFTSDQTLTEEVPAADISQSLDLFIEWYHYHTAILQEDNRFIDEDAPTMSAGAGGIAGIGIGPQGEPGLTQIQQKRHRQKVSRQSKMLRRLMSQSNSNEVK